MATINVLAELERNGIAYEFRNSDEVRIVCPFHEDNSPSCDINLEKNLFQCRASQCKQHGDFVALLARALKTTRKVVMADLGTRYTLNNEATINPSVVEKYHEKIWQAQPLLKELYKRGLTDQDVRHYRLGEHQGRITIPIKNEAGLYVNIRSYLPGAPGADKMRNLKGRAKKIRLYPVEQLAYQKIIITAGEVKAIAGATAVNKHGIGVVCATAGEGNWHQSLTPLFVGKEVWLCFDIDEAGIKAADTVARYIHKICSSLAIIKLPLDSDRYPKGDLSDFLGPERGNLLDLTLQALVWEPKKHRELVKETPVLVSLGQSSHASKAGMRLKLTGTVSTLDTSPYVIPKDLLVQCPRDQKECSLCPVFVNPEEHLYTIQDESIAILEMIDQRKIAQQQAIQDELEIPISCRVCKFIPQTFYNVEDARVSPQLTITERSNEKVLQPAICIGDGLELNESYEFVGRMHPHPLTQQSTLMISAYKPTQDALSTYKCQNTESLKLFQPTEWTVESIGEKLDDLYSDLEANVTNVFERRSVHLFCDLAYHSPLFIDFEGKRVKGWVEVLIIGDSSQGKSETVMNLQRHYSLGEKVECKNATVAGLLGGLQQFGSRWFVTWGLFPTHDRRLVILEELKGAAVEVISKLTDMRSSGIAEIPKIEKRRTYARTRVIALSNPRSNLSISQYNFGIQAIRELIGSLEDVRRFDSCLVVERSEVDPKKVNALRTNRPTFEHKYTAELCRELILWAWTVDKIKFRSAATRLILEKSIEFSDTYSEAIPIVDRGSMRYKLARLSAALAARTYSADASGETLVIQEAHVQYICNLLQQTYDSKAFGYRDFSDAEKLNSELVDPDKIEKQINDTPFPADVIKQLLYTDRIELQDIQDWCAWDRTTAQTLLSVLVRKHALVRERRHYRKTSAFITLLKGMKPIDRPDYITEEF